MQIERITFGYKRKEPILNGFDYSISQGKITSVVGPNGCGKSTLLGLCSKLYKPSAGIIHINGKNIADFRGKDFAKYVASVYQTNEITPDLTVRDLVSFGRTPYKKALAFLSEYDTKIIDQSIEITHLSNLQKRYISNLSGGERQRAYLAMALAQEPHILILDEPTTFLDMYFQVEIMEIIKDINITKNVTVMMALHDINQAIKYSDKILVLKNGMIAVHGDSKTTLTPEVVNAVFGVTVETVKTNTGQDYYIISGNSHCTL